MSRTLFDPMSVSLNDIISRKDQSRTRRQPLSMAIKSSTQPQNKQRTLLRTSPYETTNHETFKRPEHNYDTALKMLFSTPMAGIIIGNGGSSVRELMEVSRASVHVSSLGVFYPNTKERTVYITGTEGEVILAQALLWEMTGQHTFGASRSEIPIWSPSAAKDEPGKYDDVLVSGRISIPVTAAGFIFGRGGSTLRAIAEDCGVKLNLDSKEDGELTMERLVTLSGSCAGCMKATSVIFKKMVEHGQTSYVVNGTGYQRFTPHGHLEGSNKDHSEQDRDRDYRDNYRESGFRDHRERERESSFRDHRDRERDDTYSFASVGRSVSVVDRSLYDPVPIHKTNGKAVCAETLSAHTTIELAVPDNAVGCLVGVQGTVLNDIINLSGANVMISKRGEFVEGTSNRLVTIVGSPACAQTAHTLVIHKLRQHAEQDH